MKRFIGLTVIGTAFAVLIGPRGPLGGFWAASPEAPDAHGGVLAGLVAERMVENAAFGIGLAILVLGRPWFAARTATLARATVAWLATVWLFASWLPHGALHLHVGMHAEPLLPIEWIFHVGAIVAVAALLVAFDRRPEVAAQPTARLGDEIRARG
jgi:hypothetical protein